MRSVMTCDKHAGEYHSIPCSHSVSLRSILSVVPQLNRSDTQEKPLCANLPPLRVR